MLRLGGSGFVFQVATFIAVYAVWGFARIRGVGWGWAGVIWLYSLVTYVPLDIIKFAVRYIQSGKAWDLLIERKVHTNLEPRDFRLQIQVCYNSS